MKNAKEIVKEMNGVYATGDIHGEMQDIIYRFTDIVLKFAFEDDIAKNEYKDTNERMKAYDKRVALANEICDEINKKDKKDIIIMIAGDFGLYWNEPIGEREYKLIEEIKRMPFTICWVDGNHSNHNQIDKLEVSEWNGGKVHKITENCYHLMRGEIYDIKGKKWFCFGGARSHDIQDGILEKENWQEKAATLLKQGKRLFRIKDLSWWEREMPSKEEYDNGIKNLDKVGWKVDYVLTHTMPTSFIKTYFLKDIFSWGRLGKSLDTNEFTDYLQKIANQLDYKVWINGHFHTEFYENLDANKKHMILYGKMEKMYE